MSSNYSGFLAVFFVLSLLSQVSLAEDKLTLQWSYKADGRILSVATGDANNDGLPEIVAISSAKVFILTQKGDLIKSYPVKFSPSAVYVADVDNDSLNEILVGSGWLNTTDTHNPRFDFTDSSDIKEFPEYLYKTTRSQGDVYVIQENSTAPVKFLNIGEWVRSIVADDLDADGSDEIVVGAGGIDIDYVELVRKETDPDTGNLTYIRNKTERYSNNGSVMLFLQNGSLKSSYVSHNTVYFVGTAKFREGEEKEVLAGSDRVLLLSGNATLLSEFTTSQDNASVIGMYVSNIDSDSVKDLFYAYIGPVVSGIFLLKRDGSVQWEYRIPSKNILSIFPARLDLDGNEMIVVAADKAIYILDNEGRLKWSNLFQNEVSDVRVLDLDNDNYTDFVTSWGDSVGVYVLNPNFVKSLLAEKYYETAKEDYALADYKGAVSNVTSAKSIFQELSDSEGLARCQALIDKIDQELGKTKKESADNLYMTGRSEYYLGKYESAKEYLQKAREIYSQIGDAEGVSKCDSALGDIEGENVPVTKTSSVATSTFAPTTTLPEGSVEVPPAAFGILVLVIVVLLIVAVKMAKNKPKEGTPEKDKGEGGMEGASGGETFKTT